MSDRFSISLASARKNANLSQKDLADALHVTTNTISAWENGNAEPRISQAREISVVVGVPLEMINFFATKSIKN